MLSTKVKMLSFWSAKATASSSSKTFQHLSLSLNSKP
ncbi:hypothetical protein NC652_034830 [Populus alba x Populus x berolinensis]|uniref:Uncharacterized protein n=1 Tax=Populus alba x Populus x berolinensis TaxID=444605 RepID=A0AAD6LN92_9ROSI|nr:hypothetical protein NC652_034826 [Populus alba x Populus x berolinensis]KAJ6875220.1 hypothetical protein NC652_034830 [Populus alba x Populus x berolinensis]KAJ6969425.1 hypothetical protein NC653_034064 [Populus alba x Populus x berolinensis]KAJ6970243.1 hypothetical protein NC653_034738 [Populus alba x Populus x berolinensis]